MTTAEQLPDELASEMAQLVTVANECWTTQALFRLVNAQETQWHGVKAHGEHFVVIDGQPGVFDLNLRAFIPDDLVLLTERLRAKLAEVVADSPVAVGDTTASVDWTTLRIVEGQEQPSATILTTATSVPAEDGSHFELTLVTDPEGGVQVRDFERVGGAEPEESVVDGDADSGGITADYLNDYYGEDPLPFDGVGFVVDWSTWEPDQHADGGLVGSPMLGRDHDGREHDLYVWFGPDTGAQIVSAEARAGDEPAPDPAEHFAQVLLPRWYGHCADRGRIVEAVTGERLDVGKWIDGDSEHQPILLDFNGHQFTVSLRASLLGDDPRDVRATLLISAPDDVHVVATDSV